MKITIVLLLSFLMTASFMPTAVMFAWADSGETDGTIDTDTQSAEDEESGLKINANISLGEDTDADDGWKLNWDTSTVAKGSYELGVRARDDSGFWSEYASENIVVDNAVTGEDATSWP